MNILQILETRFNSVLLKELQEGYVDETETKFMAYSIHSLNKDDFEDFYNFYLHQCCCKKFFTGKPRAVIIFLFHRRRNAFHSCQIII